MDDSRCFSQILSVALVCVMAWWFTEESQGFCGWPGCRGREMCTVIRKSEIGPQERSAAIREKKNWKWNGKCHPPAEGSNTWVFVWTLGWHHNTGKEKKKKKKLSQAAKGFRGLFDSKCKRGGGRFPAVNIFTRPAVSDPKGTFRVSPSVSPITLHNVIWRHSGGDARKKRKETKGGKRQKGGLGSGEETSVR